MKDFEIKFKFDKIKYVAEENESAETDSVGDLVDSKALAKDDMATTMKVPMLNRMKSNDDAIGSATFKKKSKKSSEDSGPKLDKHKSQTNSKEGSLPSLTKNSSSKI